MKTGTPDGSVVFWSPVFKELITRNYSEVTVVNHALKPLLLQSKEVK